MFPSPRVTDRQLIFHNWTGHTRHDTRLDGAVPVHTRVSTIWGPTGWTLGATIVGPTRAHALVARSRFKMYRHRDASRPAGRRPHPRIFTTEPINSFHLFLFSSSTRSRKKNNTRSGVCPRREKRTNNECHDGGGGADVEGGWNKLDEERGRRGGGENGWKKAPLMALYRRENQLRSCRICIVTRGGRGGGSVFPSVSFLRVVRDSSYAIFLPLSARSLSKFIAMVSNGHFFFILEIFEEMYTNDGSQTWYSWDRVDENCCRKCIAVCRIGDEIWTNAFWCLWVEVESTRIVVGSVSWFVELVKKFQRISLDDLWCSIVDELQ